MKTNHFAGIFRIALACFVLLALASCGSSSGPSASSTSSGSGSSAASISGTAAMGSPVPSATITLRDAAGNSQTATSASDGSYTINVAGMTPPFLLSVNTGSGNFYGYASAANVTANLNQYTTVVLQSYYTAQGSNITTTFGGALTAASFLTAVQINLLTAPLVTALQNYLSNAGVSQPSAFNPFSTSFTANHTGFDQVLDRTVVSSGLLGFTVDSGSGVTAGVLSSTVSLVVSPASGSTAASVVIKSNTSNGSATSSSQQTVQVGTVGQQTDMAAAQAGVISLFQNMLATASSKGSALTTSDILTYVDAGYLDKGMNQTAMAQQLASQLPNVVAGGTPTVSIFRVISFNDGSPRYLLATVAISQGSSVNYVGSNDDVNYGMVFKQQPSGAWAYYGHQTIEDSHISVTQTTFYDINNSPNPTYTLDMLAQVSVTNGSLTLATVSGPANSLPGCVSNSTSNPLSLSTVTLLQDPGLYNGQYRFDLACSLVNAGALSGNPPPAGTVYVFSLTPTSASAVTSTYPLNSATNDNGVLVSINGVARSTFVASGAGTVPTVRGTTLTLAFTPPATYPLLYTYISAFCQNSAQISGGGGTDINGTANTIPAGTNSGTITIQIGRASCRERV